MYISPPPACCFIALGFFEQPPTILSAKPCPNPLRAALCPPPLPLEGVATRRRRSPKMRPLSGGSPPPHRPLVSAARACLGGMAGPRHGGRSLLRSCCVP